MCTCVCTLYVYTPEGRAVRAERESCVDVCLCDKSEDGFPGCETVHHKKIVREPQLAGDGEGSGEGEGTGEDEDDDAPEDQGGGEPRGGLDMLADAIGGIDDGSGEEPQDEVHPS